MLIGFILPAIYEISIMLRSKTIFKPLIIFPLLATLYGGLFCHESYADANALMTQAKTANPSRYQFAIDQGAEINATKDNKAFNIWWQPSKDKPTAVIVTLHGHGSYATDEFYLWQTYASKRNYAILALQWWFGGGEATADYYAPNEMYPIIAELLASKAVTPGQVLFHGFSRGAANSYAVSALDNASGNRYFGMTLSNSGGAALGYPPNREIAAGSFGKLPFKGSQWAMYCGAKDPDPNQNGCPAMKLARDWVEKYGAETKIFIEDPNGGHGGFHLNPSNVETLLTAFSPRNRYQDADTVFDWAEKQYPGLLPSHANSALGYGYYYRCYSGGSVCVGAKNDALYLYQDGVIKSVGNTQDYLAKI
jgi:hypothetical protein